MKYKAVLLESFNGKDYILPVLDDYLVEVDLPEVYVNKLRSSEEELVPIRVTSSIVTAIKD